MICAWVVLPLPHRRYAQGLSRKFIYSSLQRRLVAPSLSSQSSPKITVLNLICSTSVASARAGFIFAIDFKLEDNLPTRNPRHPTAYLVFGVAPKNVQPIQLGFA